MLLNPNPMLISAFMQMTVFALRFPAAPRMLKALCVNPVPCVWLNYFVTIRHMKVVMWNKPSPGSDVLYIFRKRQTVTRLSTCFGAT